jgi:translation initiation factor 1
MVRDLRALCGSGGTIKENEIELQGDHRSRIAEWLEGRGCQVKG